MIICDKLLNPNFPGEKEESPADPRREPVAPVKIMVPFSAASISGSTHLVAQNAPKRLILVKDSNSSDVVSRIERPFTRRAPAL